MEKRISVWSFWVGLVCVGLTIVLRLLAAIGIYPDMAPADGAPISYNTFMYGSVLMMLVSIASHFLSEAKVKS